MSRNRYKHLFIKKKRILPYTSPKTGGGNLKIPIRSNYKKHGIFLSRKFDELHKNYVRSNKEAEFSTRNGICIEFNSKADFDLMTKSLENIRQGVRLLNIQKIHKGVENKNIITRATVFIPDGKSKWFLNKIAEYLDDSRAKGTGNRANQNLIFSIENIKEAVLESFWNGNKKLIPSSGPIKCEIWLRTNFKESVDSCDFNSGKLFFDLCDKINISYNNNQKIIFPERLVVLITANKENLLKLIALSSQIAEIHASQEVASFFINQNNNDQTEWIKNLENRLNINYNSNISVCILDTGVNNGHALIKHVLKNRDCHSVNTEWEVSDKNGHGTSMAGLAIYGNLQNSLESNQKININHMIESVKLISKGQSSEHNKNLYGFVTKQGISRAEIERPENSRIICMAITSIPDNANGKPSSWSGAVDQIIFGADDNKKKLFIISAGNTTEENWKNYPSSNLVASVQSPAQSWNAITVGAYTEKDLITDSKLIDYKPLAKKGELSPFSTTSLIWDKNWLNKPDIVLEGGNIAIKKDMSDIYKTDDLLLLSTSNMPQVNQLNVTHATSAATASASYIAAKIQYEYPKIWPETVRALMIHSSDWTEAMKKQFYISNDTEKNNYKKMLKIFGYGVPNLNKAISSYKNSLTLVSEEEIQPFTKDGSRYKTKDMHFYEMPWPKDELTELVDIRVKLKFTLSYFIEPGPGCIGWKDKYRYSSHGFRFFLCMVNENEDDFKKRINKAAREEYYNSEIHRNNQWLLGTQSRDLGTVHSDILEGTAQDIAGRNLMAVVPVTGWWKERYHLKKYNYKTRYSLIVSIATPEEELNIDIYTPVSAEITSNTIIT